MYFAVIFQRVVIRFNRGSSRRQVSVIEFPLCQFKLNAIFEFKHNCALMSSECSPDYIWNIYKNSKIFANNDENLHIKYLKHFMYRVEAVSFPRTPALHYSTYAIIQNVNSSLQFTHIE